MKDVSKKEMLSDIKAILNRLDGASESLRNEAHFCTKFFVDDMRRKYGIRTETRVSVSTILDERGWMAVGEYRKKFGPKEGGEK